MRFVTVREYLPRGVKTPKFLNNNGLLKHSTAFATLFFVVLEGLEPSLAEPESDVLPLHHKTICVS